MLAYELLSRVRTGWDALKNKDRHSAQKLAALSCRLLVVGNFPTGGGRRGTAEGDLHTGTVHRRQLFPQAETVLMEATEEILGIHDIVASEVCDGPLDRFDDGVQAASLREDLIALQTQRGNLTALPAEYLPNLDQAQAHLSQYQDALEPTQLGTAVPTVAIGADFTGGKQANGVIVTKRSRGDASDFSDLADGMPHQRSLTA